MTANPTTTRNLARAAELLDAAGRQSDHHVAALHCQRAVAELTQAGATVSRTSLVVRGVDTPIAIAEALRLLAALPDEVFDNEHVAAATDAAQAAYQHLG